MDLTPRRIALHVGLFLLTFVSTTLAGAEWTYGKSVLAPGYKWGDFLSGLPYSVPFLLILSAHEFGHYFTAIYYRVRTTLPYYIPLPPLPFLIGTMGALIRLRSRIPSKVQTFDIGIAGPLAGFVATLVVLAYGFATLPPPEYVFQFHPEYEKFGLNYGDHVYSDAYFSRGIVDVVIGKNLLYMMFEQFADPARVPNVHEIMHYPFLLAGFISLVFTSLNLMPIGQLDGGHVLYGLAGYRNHLGVARIAFLILIFYSGLGAFTYIGPEADPFWYTPLYIAFLYVTLIGMRLKWQDTLMYAVIIFSAQFLAAFLVPGIKGYPGWLAFAFVVGRFIGVDHPPSEIEDQLSTTRKVLGWIALVIFIICFAPAPIEIKVYQPAIP